MKKQGCVSIVLLMLLVFIVAAGPINTFAAFPGQKEASEYNLDFSFLNLDPKTNSAEYAAGAEKFLKDGSELMECLLQDAFTIGEDLDGYYAYAEKLQLPKINEYLDQDKYFKPLAEYIENAENGFKLASYYNSMCEFEEAYKKEYTDTIAKKIDEMVAEAAGLGGNGIAQAVDLYKDAIKACDAVLLNMPNFQAAKDKKNEIQKLLEKAGGSVDSSAFASEMHKQNVGKILFSKAAVAVGKETESQFAKSFVAGDYIYGTAYLPFKAKDKIGQIDDGTYIGYETIGLEIKYYIDGNKDCYVPVEIAMLAQDYQANKSYVAFEIMPNPATAVGYNQTDWFKYVFSTLTPGKHKVTIELTHAGLGKFAEGTFEIDWTKADAAKLEKDMELASKNAVAYRANLRKMPVEFTAKHLSFTDASITDAKIKEMFLRKYPNAVKIIKLVNQGTSTGSWIIEKDEYGLPTGKRATMETWLMYQDKDGWYRFTKFWMYCEYAGFGTYNEPTFSYEMQHTKISPKNVK